MVSTEMITAVAQGVTLESDVCRGSATVRNTWGGFLSGVAGEAREADMELAVTGRR